MPPRKARASLPVAGPKTARNKNRKRNLDAYSIASHDIPTKTGPRHRLGELLDDRPQRKRPRAASDDEDDESADDDVPSKRRKPSAAADDEEDGSDSEGNEWTLGGLREDDEDSELDSDEAFDEEDEERFAGYTFRGSSSSGGKKSRGRSQDEKGVQEIDLDEDDVLDDAEEDDFGDEGVDLATMLDDEASDEGMRDESGSESEEEDDQASENDSSQDEDEEDDPLNEERIARVRDRLDALDATTTSTSQPPPRRSTGLTMEALLAASGNSPAVKEAARASKKAKPFEAPLPQRQQDRINRKVASQKANEQLDRWLPTVKQRREAEHLTFPLVDPERSEPKGKDKFVHDGEKPLNDFEKAMRDILEESGMVGDERMGEEDGSMNVEGLLENKPSLQEVMDHRAELRRRRDILFDAERKAKRISRIKSKAYRRVHRRERQRHAELERELNGFGDENEREMAERKRAEARMSTKARDSKWAKSLKASNRTVWDTEARDSVHEKARREKELRRRVAGEDVGDEGSGNESSGEENSEDEDQATLKKLDRISRDGKDNDRVKGLAGLDFMKAADERQRKRNDEDIERLRKELAIEDGDEVSEGEEDEGVDDQGLGRAVFGPKAKEQKEPGKKVKRAELEEGEDSEEEEVSDNEADEIFKNGTTKHLSSGGPSKTGVNGNASNSFKHNVSNERKITTSDMGGWFTKSSKADKLKAGRVVELGPAKDPESRESSSLATAAQAGRKAAEGEASAKDTDGWTVVDYTSNNADDNESGSESDRPNPILTKQQQRSEFHRRAFAGDAVKKSFDAEKAEAVQAEDEQEISNHLPGWGSWTGAGLMKSIKKSNARARHNPLYKTKLAGINPADRKDARLENVIISEKSDRKGKKYQADLLPHVFETKNQYERSLRVPMGPEWVTKETHQRATKPRVLVKPGVVIGAMEKPLV